MSAWLHCLQCGSYESLKQCWSSGSLCEGWYTIEASQHIEADEGAQEEQKVAILGARLGELGVDWERLLEAAGDGT